MLGTGWHGRGTNDADDVVADGGIVRRVEPFACRLPVVAGQPSGQFALAGNRIVAQRRPAGIHRIMGQIASANRRGRTGDQAKEHGDQGDEGEEPKRIHGR